MAHDVSTQQSEQGHPGLIRAIGPTLLFFFILGDVLGTGIYAVSGDVAGEVGGALWAPFLMAFVIAMLTATSYLELVGKYPRAAGAALYTHRAFKTQFLTFVVAFAVMCSGITSAGAASLAFGGDYLTEFVKWPTLAVGVGLVVVLALVNFVGVAYSVKANLVFTLLELAGLLLIIGIGVVALGQGTGEPARLTEFNPEAGSAFAAITAGAALAFFAMVGFEDSVNMAEETKDPRRNFPRSMLAALTVAGALYLLVAVASSLLVDVATLSGSEGPLLEVVKAGAAGFPLILFSAVALVAITNGALINLMMASRLLYGMSRERIIPAVFGKVHDTRRTPWVAIIFTSALAVALVVYGKQVELLGSTTAFLLLCVFTVVNIACLVLRRDRVEHDHFRAPTVFPVLGAAASLYLATPLSGTKSQVYVTAGLLLAVGVLLWLVNRAVVGRVEADPARLGAG